MYSYTKQQIVLVLVTIALTGIALFLLGCGGQTITPTPFVVPTPAEVLVKVVEKTDWLTTVSIIGIGIGIFSFLNGNTKIGIAGTGACLVVLVTSLSVARYYQQYAMYGAIIGAVSVAGILAYGIYIKQKALREIIANIQAFKGVPNVSMSTDLLKEYLYNQSKTTQGIVTDIKKTL